MNKPIPWTLRCILFYKRNYLEDMLYYINGIVWGSVFRCNRDFPEDGFNNLQIPEYKAMRDYYKWVIRKVNYE